MEASYELQGGIIAWRATHSVLFCVLGVIIGVIAGAVLRFLTN